MAETRDMSQWYDKEGCMTEAAKARISAILSPALGDPCHRCRRVDGWAHSDKVTNLVGANGELTPMVMLICKECGECRLYSAMVLLLGMDTLEKK